MIVADGELASRYRHCRQPPGRTGRPAIVIAREGDTAKGSGRSIKGVDLWCGWVTAARQAGLLVNGGGHVMAAGLTVESSKIGSWRIS